MTGDYARRVSQLLQSTRAGRELRRKIKASSIDDVMDQLSKAKLNANGEELELRERLLRYGLKLTDPGLNVLWFEDYDDNPDAPPALKPLACPDLWTHFQKRSKHRAGATSDSAALSASEGEPAEHVRRDGESSISTPGSAAISDVVGPTATATTTTIITSSAATAVAWSGGIMTPSGMAPLPSTGRVESPFRRDQLHEVASQTCAVVEQNMQESSMGYASMSRIAWSTHRASTQVPRVPGTSDEVRASDSRRRRESRDVGTESGGEQRSSSRRSAQQVSALDLTFQTLRRDYSLRQSSDDSFSDKDGDLEHSEASCDEADDLPQTRPVFRPPRSQQAGMGESSRPPGRGETPRASSPLASRTNRNRVARVNPRDRCMDRLRQWGLRFSGEAQDNPDEFLEDLEECRTSLNLPGEDILAVLSNVLSKSASMWYRKSRKY